MRLKVSSLTAAYLLCSRVQAVELAISQNFADPSITYTGENGWLAFSTTNKVLNIPIASSPDFTTWTVIAGKDAMPTLPAWVYSPNPAVASPDINLMPDSTYHIYFDATPTNNTWRRCVGVATSSDPQGPFQPSDQPLACGDNKYGFIDPSGFADPMTNKRYLLYKLDGTNPGPPNAPLSPVPAIIYIQELAAPDYLTMTGDAIPILSSANDPSAYGTVEAPSLLLIRADPHAYAASSASYVLFYSCGFYQNSTYTVSYATASNMTGPYTKQGALLQTGDDGLSAPGGADVAYGDDEWGSANMVFHANAGRTFNDTRFMWTAMVSFSGGDVSLS